MLPQLVVVDSQEITPKERIAAGQNFEELMAELDQQIEKKRLEDLNRSPEEREKEYNPESRRKMYKEMQEEEQKRDESRQGKKPEPKAPSPMYNKDGELRQCNEGRYEYKLREWEDPDWSYFEMPIPNFIETSQLEFELFPCFVSAR